MVDHAVSSKSKVLIPEVVDRETDSVHIACVLNPFEPELIKFEVPEGASIADILRGEGMGTRIPARIFVDGSIVLESERETVRPRAGQFVTIRVEVRGGNKGLTVGLEILATIAAAAATWYLGPTGAIAFEALGANAATAFGLSSAAIGAGVSLLENLAIRAVLPSPRR